MYDQRCVIDTTVHIFPEIYIDRKDTGSKAATYVSDAGWQFAAGNPLWFANIFGNFRKKIQTELMNYGGMKNPKVKNLMALLL